MSHSTLRTTLVVASLALGLVACSSSTTPDGGTTVTGTGTTTGGSGASTAGTTTASTSTSTSTSAGSTAGSTGAATTGSGTTGTGTSAGDTTGAATTAGGNNGGATVNLRFANFAPDNPGPVDFCYFNGDDQDAGWQGPVLALNGQPNGISYPQISGYESLNGPMQVARIRVLPLPFGNAASACQDAGTLGADIDMGFSQQPIGAGKNATLALEGFVGGSATYKLTVFGYLDEPQPPGANTAFRFINASPQQFTFDFGLGTAATSFTPLVSTVPYSTFGSGAGIDSAGYQVFVSDGGIYVFDVQQTGVHTDVINIDNVNMPNDNLGFSFFFGTDTSSSNPWALFCNDVASDGTFTACYFADGGLLVVTDGG